jgi:hypothetical protein
MPRIVQHNGVKGRTRKAFFRVGSTTSFLAKCCNEIVKITWLEFSYWNYDRNACVPDIVIGNHQFGWNVSKYRVNPVILALFTGLCMPTSQKCLYIGRLFDHTTEFGLYVVVCKLDSSVYNNWSPNVEYVISTVYWILGQSSVQCSTR